MYGESNKNVEAVRTSPRDAHLELKCCDTVWQVIVLKIKTVYVRSTTQPTFQVDVSQKIPDLHLTVMNLYETKKAIVTREGIG